jgi:hypothetical protein
LVNGTNREHTMVQIAEGIEQTWLHDEQIAVYTVTHLTDEALLQWSQSILQTLMNWRDDANQVLTLYDISESGVSIPLLMRTDYHIRPGLTPKGQDYVNRILESRPDMHIYLAVIIPTSGSGNVMAAKSQLQNTSTITTILFFSYDKAIEWLEARLV